jgi:hypothetical protein
MERDPEAELTAKYAERRAELHRQLDAIAARTRRSQGPPPPGDHQALADGLKRLAAELRAIAAETPGPRLELEL